MAPPLAPDEPFIRQKGSAMRKDPCYTSYMEALQCLDKHDYQQQLCAEAFSAFKACRNKQEEASHLSMMQAHETDPLWGWAFKLYNKSTAEQQNSSSSNSNSSSSSSKAFEEDPLWGWAFRWYNGKGKSAAEDRNSSSDGTGVEAQQPQQQPWRQQQS